jgi:hypothetical protein
VMGARRLTSMCLVWLCALTGLFAFALACAPAWATVTHEYLSSPHIVEVPGTGPKGESVPSPGPFLEGSHMTVDAGELYVVDGFAESSRLDKFDGSSGAFVSQFPGVASPSLQYINQGVAVAHASGEVYVGADAYPKGSPEGAVAVFDAAGGLQATWDGADTPSKAFGCFECNVRSGDVAVDNSTSLGDWAAGDVYVADPLHAVVDIFKPGAGGKEEYVTQLTGPEPPGALFSNPTGVAVSALDGEVVIQDGQSVDIFKPATISGQYEFVKKLTGTPSGGAFKGLRGVAVDSGNGEIYALDNDFELQVGVVDQFDATGQYLGHLTGTPAGPFVEVKSVAIDQASHRVYVSEHNLKREPSTVIDAFGTDVVIPDVTTGAATGVKPASATLNGTVNPDEAGEASCQFAWGATKAFGRVVACEPEKVAEAGSPVAVHAALTGLQPDTTYYYRLQASNGNGTNPGEATQDGEFTMPGPGMHSESVSNVASTSATFDAAINPHGASTSYYFQYGTSSDYTQATSVPLPPGIAIGSGEADMEVTQHVQNLSASTIYHYRVVAIGELEVSPGSFEAREFDGPDQTFTTQTPGALTLPDGRAWELVSPADKHGARIEAISNNENLIQASAAGDALTYRAVTPTELTLQGYDQNTQVLSTEGADGWSSKDLSAPHEAPVGLEYESGYRFFSEDLSLGYLMPGGLQLTPLSPWTTERTPYISRQGSCEAQAGTSECYVPLVSGKEGYADVPPGTKFGETSQSLETRPTVKFAGATPDLSHVILDFVNPVPLSPIPAGTENLFEWSADKSPTERLQLVTLLPQDEGGQSTSGSLGGRSIGGSITRGAISHDGSRVFWTDNNLKHLYMRDLAKGESLRIDVRQPGVTGPVIGNFDNAAFQFSADSGSKVFFTDGERLTLDSGAREVEPDLYECDIVEEAGKLACKLRDLTPLTASGESAGLRNIVLGASGDGSSVYFVANGVLAEGATPGDCTETEGNPGEADSESETCNLYLLRDGATKFVATLGGGDTKDWGVLNERGFLAKVTVRMSPNGRFLAFLSYRSLTGYDNRDAISGRHDEEVYIYDAQTARLACASCDPTGARPVGVEVGASESPLVAPKLKTGKWFAGYVPSWTTENYQSRYMSDSGRLFFDSTDALVPQDINGTMDVYQYEPAGIGGCTGASVTFSAGAGGCVGLISSGNSREESAFLDASESDDDVFFLTSEKLVAQDTDTALDVYDAHVCTAKLPCASAPASPPPCTTADACRTAPSPQPSIFGSPASATFAGVGNITPSGAPPVVKSKSLSRAQQLARALKGCRGKPHKKRVACERKARKRYGAKRARRAKATNRSGK